MMLKNYSKSFRRQRAVFQAITALKAMHAKGYKYAISGMVHPLGRITEEMSCDFIPIPDSSGSYGDMIR